MEFNYTELKTLANKLIDAEAEFTIHPLLHGMQIVGKRPDGDNWDAILHEGSYGREKNLLEIMGLDSPGWLDVYGDDEVAGWLTGYQVFALWYYTTTGDDVWCKTYFKED